MSDTRSLPPATLAVITGASAGLGSEYARLAAADGHALLLVARRADRLKALAAELREARGVSVSTVAADLTTDAGRQAVVDAVAAADTPLEISSTTPGLERTRRPCRACANGSWARSSSTCSPPST